MGFAISHLWHLIGQDAESTSYNVARKFLDEPDLPSDAVTHRAEALHSISHIFAVRWGCSAALHALTPGPPGRCASGGTTTSLESRLHASEAPRGNSLPLMAAPPRCLPQAGCLCSLDTTQGSCAAVLHACACCSPQASLYRRVHGASSDI